MFISDFKRMFMKGLGALLPTIVTIALVVWAFNWISSYVATPITDGIIAFLPEKVPVFLRTDPIEDVLKYGEKIEEFHPRTGQQLTVEYRIIWHPAVDDPDPAVRAAAQRRRAEAMWHIVFAKWRLNMVGFVLAIVIVYIVGYFLTGLLGRTTWRIVESLVLRVPLVRSVYPNIKQVTDFLLGDRQFAFKGVVAAEYPRKGVWSLGLVTGPAMKSIQSKSPAEDMATIFVPSSPTPFTGYTVMLRRSEVVELPLSIDEALRFTISGGVIKPPLEGGQPEMAMGDFPDSGKWLQDKKNSI